MAELSLPGGNVNSVVRVGETVRRPLSPAFTREVLGFLGRRGWSGAPRFIGVDEKGREILSFVEGYVAWEDEPPPDAVCDQSLAMMAGLVREFHDLTAGTAMAGGHEVVCHNDLSPRNTVYRDLGSGLRPVAVIDWDLAAPGARMHDVAHMCWQFVGLGPGVADLADAARRIRLICDAYGLADRGLLVKTILWWQDRCWRGIEAGAAAGDTAMIRLSERGASRAVRDAYRWVAAHRLELENRIQS